ncbi:MFS transporter [Lacisediminihabitans sp.]|uniref:MFS transporter n=1 Tax=Lacisediminihabitans sp. TaxID=2787631 RepID=UPI002F94C17F
MGALVDRGDRRRLLYLANFSRALLFALVTVLVILHAAPLAALYIIYAAMGVIESLSDSSTFAVLPQAVAPGGLDRANAQIAGTQIIVDEFVGPPLGGLLFGLAAFAPTGLNAIAFLAAGISYFLLRGDYTRPIDATAPRTSILADIREGAEWTLSHVVLRTLIIVGTLASIGYMIPFSYLVLYANDTLGLDATGYGLLLSFSAVGGLAGTWVAGKLKKRLGYGWSILGALSLGAAAFITISLSRNIIVVAIALAAYICHSMVWNVLASSVRHKATPNAIMGRVNSMSRLLGLLGLALGAFLGGSLAGLFGLQLPFFVAGCLFIAAGLVCLVAMPHFRTWERDQRQREAEAALQQVAD